MNMKLLLVGVLSAMLLVGCDETPDPTVNATEEVEASKTETEENSVKNDKHSQKDYTSKNVNDKEDLNEKITVQLDYVEAAYPDYDVDRYGYEMYMSMTFFNNTDKEVRGFSGTAYFYDIFGDLLDSVTLKYDDDVILADGMMEWVGVLEINQFNDEDMRLFNTPSENIDFSYSIDKIVFTDGTVLD